MLPQSGTLFQPSWTSGSLSPPALMPAVDYSTADPAGTTFSSLLPCHSTWLGSSLDLASLTASAGTLFHLHCSSERLQTSSPHWPASASCWVLLVQLRPVVSWGSLTSDEGFPHPGIIGARVTLAWAVGPSPLLHRLDSFLGLVQLEPLLHCGSPPYWLHSVALPCPAASSFYAVGDVALSALGPIGTWPLIG